MKKLIAIVCTLVMLIGLLPVSALPAQAALVLSDEGVYQVGYAKVDLNPYVVEHDPSSGIMLLPLAGVGDNWNRLSEDGLIDDNGDGVIDENDGIKATCIAITDSEGNTALLITVDLLSGYMNAQIRPAIVESVNAAIAAGELENTKEITANSIYYSGTHTHNSIAVTSYASGGKTGTNNDGVDLSVVNENLGIWIERAQRYICQMAMDALNDRAAATLTKDQLAVADATSEAVVGKRLQATRHYQMDVDGDKFVGGNGFNAVDKWDYANPDDYRTPRGVDPKQVTRAEEIIKLLRFSFEDETKLPVVYASWASHPSKNNSDTYEGSSKLAVSGDYVIAFCHALEYGCDITIDPTNGYLQGWSYGTTRKYRAAFFQADGGNVNGGSDELVTYSGSEGDVVQYGSDWYQQSAKSGPIKNSGSNYGVVLAQLATECLSDGKNEVLAAGGTLQIMTRPYTAAKKTIGVTELGYYAALAYQAANAIKTVGLPYKYTDPDTEEVFLIASRFHASNLVSYWDETIAAPIGGTLKMTLNTLMLGDDVAFVTMPGETFNFYYKDTTLTGDAKYSQDNNLWHELADEATYGEVFVISHCNAYVGYIPNDEAYVYNWGSTKWASGSYEAHSSKYERGTGEEILRIYDQMLTALTYNDADMSYTGYCEHCGENQLWQPYGGQTTLTTGHYYLCSNAYTASVKISGGQTVCLDLNGHILRGETRAFTLSDSTKDVLNIMDSSEEQTGAVQAYGALYGAGRSLYGGTINIVAGDELNLYSGTITCLERTAYSVLRGGVLYNSGTFNMYGGAVVGGTASSFTGSYYSNGAVTATKTAYGGTIFNAGTCNFYGGSVNGGKTNSLVGTVTTTEESYTYTETKSDLEDHGPCIWNAGQITLGGDAQLEHLRFAGDGGLTVAGKFTGSAEIEFNTLTDLTDLTKVGEALNADVSMGQITFTDAPGKVAAVRGEELVISEYPYSYEICEVCGSCQWMPVTQADLKASGMSNMAPGHYRLTEDVKVDLKRLNENGDLPGAFCIDLAGHTYTGTTRPFAIFDGASLNIFDSVGGGVMTGNCSSTAYGGVLYLYPGSTVSLYGGTLKHSDTVIANGGVVSINGGSFVIHGGKIQGASVTGKGGAVLVTLRNGVYGSFTATGGEITGGNADGGGDCVYVTNGCAVNLSGDARIEELCFAGSSAQTLTVENFAGSATLRYPNSLSLADGTALGGMSGELSGQLKLTATCKVVGISENTLIAQTGHDYIPVITAPGCVSTGYTTYTCSGCGDSYTADEVGALGHSYETVTVEATCTEEGLLTHTCTGCGDVQTTTIPATGHSYEAVITPPTCTEAGYSTYRCGACEDSYVTDETPAVGHTNVGGVCRECDRCQACGETQWTLLTASEMETIGTSLKTGHYRLAESIETAQLTVSGHCCLDLGGYTLTGTDRAFYLGTGATLNILDSAGGGILEGKSGASVTGGVIYGYTNAVISLYGGTLRHNTANSETVTTGGVICVSGSTFNLYGGTVEGAKVTGYGGAIMVSSRGGQGGAVNAFGGRITAGSAGSAGACVYVNSGCTVNLSGDAQVEQIRFAGASGETLTITGPFSGQTVLRYTGAAVPEQGTVLGRLENGELYQGSITVASYPCLVVTPSGDALVADIQHSYERVTVEVTCTADGSITDTCTVCGDTQTQILPTPGHDLVTVAVDPTCTADGSITISCTVCGESTVGAIPATGHSFADGTCSICGEADPDFVKPVVIPTLTLKSPALEFKDMIKVVAFFTAENIDDVVEMGMVTYTEKVDVIDVNTAAFVIPGAEYEAGSGRYFASSQGINAKYLADTVYLACYAKLSDGTYVYTKLAPYSPITYATNQLKNSTNTQLKQLVAAMLNYGAAAQVYFNYNVENLANASLTAEQLALPESYRDDMVSTVPAADATKQGAFANNKGFSQRKPAVSFEGAFSINYFFTPAYTPVDGITLYYWTEADFNAVDELTVENATGSVLMEGEGTSQHRGDITGIAAKNISQAVYVAAVYSDGTTTWTSGVLGYSIGAYCGSLATKGGTAADLAMATAVYGYHAKQYFGA